MIRISFNTSDRRVVTALRVKGPQVQQEILDELDTLLLELQRRIMRKLTGEVLQQRSGKAAASVTKEPIELHGNVITGTVSAGGGPAWYLRVHEKGGTRPYTIEPVNKKALAFFPSSSVGGSILRGGRTVPGFGVARGLRRVSGARRGELKESKYKTFGEMGGVVVKRVEHPPLPARPFMSTSLAEMRSEFITRIRAAAARGLRS